MPASLQDACKILVETKTQCSPFSFLLAGCLQAFTCFYGDCFGR